MFHNGVKIITSFTLANTNKERTIFENRSSTGMAFSEDMVQWVSALDFTDKATLHQVEQMMFFSNKQELRLNAQDNIFVVLAIKLCKLIKPVNDWRQVLCASMLPVCCGLFKRNLCNLTLPKRNQLGGSALMGGITELIRSSHYGLLSGWFRNLLSYSQHICYFYCILATDCESVDRIFR